MAATWLTNKDGTHRRWKGGRIRIGKDGEPVYVIERMHAGTRYTKSLEAGNETQALAELALFDRDPAGYVTATQAKAQLEARTVRLDETTIASFMAFLRGAKLDEEGQALIQRDKRGTPLTGPDGLPLEIPDKERYPRSLTYRKSTKAYLTKWAEFYADRDIRTVDLQEVRQQLVRWGSAKKSRTIALKSFMSFLREERFLLRAREDPTLDLKVAPPRAAKGKRATLGERKFYEMDHVARIYANITSWESATRPVEGETLQAIRDTLRLCAHHGMHVSEVERLARGEGRVRVLKEQGEIAGTITFIHKTMKVHVVSLTAQSLAAAQRLQVRGAVPVDSYRRKVIARAARAAERAEIDLGTLRHCFTTWSKSHGRVVKAAEGGAPLTVIAAVLGHESTQTTSRFYDGTEIPDMIVLPLELKNLADPIPMTKNSAAHAGHWAYGKSGRPLAHPLRTQRTPGLGHQTEKHR
jgi:hypothetical protein